MTPASTRGAARTWVVLGGIAGALLLGGCGADEVEAATAAPGSATATAALACAKDRKPVAVPASFPASAAPPQGYVVSGVEARSGGRTVITAVSPKPFTQTLAEMQTAYSTRGWTPSEGEVEERDAESNFAGNGMRGRWTAREIPDCHDNTAVSVLVGK
jgi:hypothetical protein